MSCLVERRAYPLFDEDGPVPASARDLVIEQCPVEHARDLVAAWHSRMPVTQVSPWQYAFAARCGGITYGVALWHNPSARMLPSHWLELRRLAVADDAPHCTASRMLGQMARWFRRHAPERERLISYQDVAVHQGTIYAAAGWTAAHTTPARKRDRSSRRPGGRLYRWDTNGADAHSSAKVRWEMEL